MVDCLYFYRIFIFLWYHKQTDVFIYLNMLYTIYDVRLLCIENLLLSCEQLCERRDTQDVPQTTICVPFCVNQSNLHLYPSSPNSAFFIPYLYVSTGCRIRPFDIAQKLVFKQVFINP